MIIGIFKETKGDEYRVAITPDHVEILIQQGHEILVETKSGKASGFTDGTYQKAGAKIVKTAAEVFQNADLLIHVKEPQPHEYGMLRKNQILFTYLHLAASLDLTQALIQSGVIGIAYETIQKPNGSLPLLTPMSEVAGRMAIQEGAKYLEMEQGGLGILLGGVTGVHPGIVVVIGGGTVGMNAAKMACGLGAKVYLLDNNLERLSYLSDVMPKNCFPLMNSPAKLRKLIKEAHVVVGAVLIPGSKAPHLITKEMLKSMKKGAVLVDVAIDQGGCFETSRATTHKDPIYTVDGIVHYCVANMPGAVPRTSTYALTNATLPYVLEIANKGWQGAMRDNPEIRHGANIIDGQVTYKGVSDAFDLPFVPIEKFL